MDKYIGAEAFKKRLIVKGFYPAIVARTLEEMPAADVVERSSFEQVSQKYLKFQQKHLNGELVEVRHAKWTHEGGGYFPRCSICNRWSDVMQGTADFNFCPHCGAKMDGGNEK